MRNLALCAVFLSASVALAQSDGGVVKYINPFIGTGAVGQQSYGKYIPWRYGAFWHGAAQS